MGDHLIHQGYLARSNPTSSISLKPQMPIDSTTTHPSSTSIKAGDNLQWPCKKNLEHQGGNPGLRGKAQTPHI